jgi:hypothetical protein
MRLLHLSWLVHLGFRHMMPIYHGREIHRFRCDEQATTHKRISKALNQRFALPDPLHQKSGLR